MRQLQDWLRRLPESVRPGPSLGFDLVRAYLGIGLFVRGILFVSRPELLMNYLSSTNDWFLPYAIAHYVAIAHLGGGLLLAVGLVTRLAAIVQLPILFGAVFLIHSGEGLMLTAGQSLEFSALVLMLLVIYMVFGAGPLSVDAKLTERGGLFGDALSPELQPTTAFAQKALEAGVVTRLG
jgi:putative oxidoreductase